MDEIDFWFEVFYFSFEWRKSIFRRNGLGSTLLKNPHLDLESTRASARVSSSKSQLSIFGLSQLELYHLLKFYHSRVFLIMKIDHESLVLF